MRHTKKNNHLSRTASHRRALLSNMASSLILNKRITTTVAKAKELRRYVEPLITRSKSDTTHSRRVIFSYLQNKYSVTELFNKISEKIATRPGGYTRIIKTSSRLGDSAEMCIIELVDYNNLLIKEETETKVTRTRRSRRSPSKEKKGDEKIILDQESVEGEDAATDEERTSPEQTDPSDSGQTDDKETK